MRMNDFFGWVNGKLERGSLNRMDADWQNRNQTPLPQKEEEIEEIVVDEEEE